MTEQMGELINKHTVRLERLFPGPVERVWDYFTNPDILSSWLMPCSIERKHDGLIELISQHDPDGPLPDAIPIRGLISAYDRPHLFAFAWYEHTSGTASELSLELREQGDQVVLVLTHAHLNPEIMASVAAGWHTHLITLLALLKGEEKPDFFPTFEKVFEEYKILLAGAGVVVVATAASPALAAEMSDQAYQQVRAQRQELLARYDALWKDAKNINDDIDRLEKASVRNDRALDGLYRDLKYKKMDMHQIELDVRDLDRVLH